MRLVRYTLYNWRNLRSKRSLRSVLVVITRHVLSVASGVGLLLLSANHARVVHRLVAVSDVVGHPLVLGTDVELSHSFRKSLLGLSLYLSLDLSLHALLPLVCLLVDLALVTSFELT